MRVGFRTVPCDVAARRGWLPAGGLVAGPGEAEPGRGATDTAAGWPGPPGALHLLPLPPLPQRGE